MLVIPADSSNRKQSDNRSAVFVTKFAEFLAIAKPVIATRLDIISRIVETYDCGFVCEANAESIAESIREARSVCRGNSNNRISIRDFNMFKRKQYCFPRTLRDAASSYLRIH